MATKLRKIEKEVLIPRHLEYKITHELCREEQKEFSECAKETGIRIGMDCQYYLKKFHDCSNRWFRDEELKKQVENEYIEKREYFKKSGKPYEKSPFSRVG